MWWHSITKTTITITTTIRIQNKTISRITSKIQIRIQSKTTKTIIRIKKNIKHEGGSICSGKVQTLPLFFNYCVFAIFMVKWENV